MFIGPDNCRLQIRNPWGAFTLLEIMLAVGILGMMSLAIFRFVQSNMTALQLSSGTSAADAQYDGLRDLLTTEWQSLSPFRANMTGEPFKLGDRERDEIKWSCGAGLGLLTRYAPGDFTVTLRLQPENEKRDRLDLGLLRKPQDVGAPDQERDQLRNQLFRPKREYLAAAMARRPVAQAC